MSLNSCSQMLPNSLPNENILGSRNRKHFADDKFNAAQLMISVFLIGLKTL